MMIYRALLSFLLLVLMTAAVYPSLEPFTVPSGASSKAIATKLQEEGFVSSKWGFYLYLKSKGIEGKLRKGSFYLDPDYSYERISNVLMEKEGPASLVRITIPEGYTISEISEELQKNGVVNNAKKFMAYVNTQGRYKLKKEFQFLEKVPTANLEGYLFPETYVMAKGISYQAILRQFLSQFSKKALPLWQKHHKRLSIHDWVTLASIVEKESYKRDEMPIISGVFHNRLRKRMILASCPTVAYAMGQPRKKSLTYSDLKYQSPYNTYIRQGLPPSPIASPGLRAMEATLFPQKTPYLYFVANGDGSHSFTTTLRAHLNKQKEILSKKKLN